MTISRRDFMHRVAATLAGCCCAGRKRRSRCQRRDGPGPADHPRAEVSLVRLLRQAGVRPHGPLRAGHGGGLRAPLAAARRRGQDRHGGPPGWRPLDRAGADHCLVLAAGLHVAVAARLADRGALERPRRRPIRVPHPRRDRHASCARCRTRSTASVRTGDGRWPTTSGGWATRGPGTATTASPTRIARSRRRRIRESGMWIWRRARPDSSSASRTLPRDRLFPGTFRRPNTGSITCWSIPTARGSSSCTAGSCPTARQ